MILEEQTLADALSSVYADIFVLVIVEKQSHRYSF